MLARTTLRSVLGQHDLDEMLSERKKLSTDVQSILGAQTETWGIKVSNVEINTLSIEDDVRSRASAMGSRERLRARLQRCARRGAGVRERKGPLRTHRS
jgi:regulator of protease activity HflC (stomatin/prohibitin superfamily)